MKFTCPAPESEVLYSQVDFRALPRKTSIRVVYPDGSSAIFYRDRRGLIHKVAREPPLAVENESQSQQPNHP